MATYCFFRSGVLRGLTNENPPYCDPTKKNALPTARGDCGDSFVAIPFLVSYLIINFLIMVNIFIAAILESFDSARDEVNQG